MPHHCIIKACLEYKPTGNTVPLVDLFNRYALPLGNILHCFTALRDDANISCDGPCCDRMVTSHHDNLKSQDPNECYQTGKDL